MASSTEPDSGSPSSRQPTTAPSSPFEPGDDHIPPWMPGYVEPDEAHYDAVRAEMRRIKLLQEEEKARIANEAAEKKRLAALKRRSKKKKRNLTAAERQAKARALDQLIRQSQAFSEFLTERSGGTLGQIGSGLAGKALGEQELKIADQPKCMTGGVMRKYQLEGLTWIMKLCEQGLSGILADEMGLGKSGLQSYASKSSRQLTWYRENYPDHRGNRPAARKGELSGASSHCCSAQHLVELDRRVPPLDTFDPGRHVPRHSR